MKVTTTKTRIKFSGLAFFMLLCIVGSEYTCLAQSNIKDCATAIPKIDSVPRMWVKYKRGEGYEDNYIKLQWVQLSNYLKNHNQGTEETKSIFYSKNAFQKMIEYFESLGNYNFLHVYIASYGDVGSKFTPAGYENKLTLLFAPALDSQYDKVFYSITPSGNFDPNSDSCVIKTTDWINNYSQKMQIALLNNLPANSDNEDHSRHFSDTRRIEYYREDICQLFTEFNYQYRKHGTTVSGLQAFFSSYPATGHPNNGRFKNRLFVLFEFTRNKGGKNEVFYIDRQTGFGNRKTPNQEPNPLEEMNYNLYSVDNGHLCPPNCP